MDADQVLAFRLARSGLVARDARGLAEAAACPASDFARDAALLALAARIEGLTRDAYDHAADAGDVVVAHVVRGAIHALAPGDLALYGRALIARDDDELGVQLGQQVRRLAEERGFAPREALDEVAAATKDALSGGAVLDKNALHEELRGRVSADLMPWCRGVREPPRGSDALALRHDRGGRSTRLRAPLHARQARPQAEGERSRAPLPRLLWTGGTRRLRRVGRAGAAPCPPVVGRGGGRARRGAGGKEHGMARGRRPGRARVAARGGGHPPDPARRPLSAEAQPAAARTGP